MKFFDQQADVIDTGDSLVIERSQYIDPVFLQSLKDKREASKSVREGEFMQVCSVPVAIVDKWKREGFDIFTEPARAIVARLKLENLDDFLTTNKEV